MKVSHIYAKYKGEIVFPEKILKKLPNKIMFFTDVQFLHLKDDMISQLKAYGIEVKTYKTNNTIQETQLLGCNIEEIEGDFDAFLYVGDGNFHPTALLYGNKKEVFQYNPFSEKLFKVDRREVDKNLKREKAGLVNFLTKNKIGVLVSLKYGQNHYKRALKLKEKYSDKEFYYFISDNLNPKSLEDFNFVEVFVNTACPRIGYEDNSSFSKPIVNISTIEQL